VVNFFDQPVRVTRFKLVHAVWRRQRMEVLPGVALVSLLLARTDDTVVGLTDVGGYPNGFVFVLRVRWRLVTDPEELPPWPFPDWGSPDPLAAEPFPDALLRFGVQFADGRKVTNLDMYPFVPEDLPPDQPVLVEGGAGRPTPSSRSPTTAGCGWRATRTWGPRRCSTRWASWGMRARTRRSLGRCAPAGCGRTASRARRPRGVPMP
jgi:hypothetical protein